MCASMGQNGLNSYLFMGVCGLCSHATICIYLCVCVCVCVCVSAPLKKSIMGMDETSGSEHGQSGRSPNTPENCDVVGLYLKTICFSIQVCLEI